MPQQTGELGEVAEPCVLDSSPDALSIGRRCAQQGYASSWKLYSSKPTLTKPDGAIINLVSRGCCPYLDDYEPEGYNVAAPALGKSDLAYASRRSDVVACESEDDPAFAYASRRSDVVACESGNDPTIPYSTHRCRLRKRGRRLGQDWETQLTHTALNTDGVTEYSSFCMVLPW